MWRTFYLYGDAWGNVNRIALRKPKKLRSLMPAKEVELYQIKYDAYFCQYQLALNRLSDKTLVGVCQTAGGAHADCFADRSCTELLTKVLYDGSIEYEFELPSKEIDDCERYCWAPDDQ
ncbi:hypothetical protein AAVH_12943 [Aphelenchoides avenae]|nr:hypothetical protein AAVH_12943 [Aphelenchus avenae]